MTTIIECRPPHCPAQLSLSPGSQLVLDTGAGSCRRLDHRSSIAPPDRARESGGKNVDVVWTANPAAPFPRLCQS